MPNIELLEEIIKQILEARSKNINFIIVHGAGSYGHLVAKEYDVISGYDQNTDQNSIDKKKFGFCKTHSGLMRLNNLIVEKFLSHGLPIIGLHPLIFEGK